MTEPAATSSHEVELLRESIADLQAALARDEAGWQRVEGAGQFTKADIDRMAGRCRAVAIVNPLIKRGLALRAGYVHGGGVSITTRAAGDQGGQDVASVVADWVDDNEVRHVLTGAQARQTCELALGTDGNLFITLFTDPLTGRVRPRVLPFEQVTSVIADPEDSFRRWYYKREWAVTSIDAATGRTTTTRRTEYYPSLGYYPAARPRAIGGHPVNWDAPVYHVRVNAPHGWDWGVPDAHPAAPWAIAYKGYLEDWARLMKALARVAWVATAKDPKNATALRGGLAAVAANGEAGQSVSLAGDATLTAAPKAGATIDSESGKPLAGMVAAALGVPVTMLLSDPGQTGARAVAETLDKPTELEMGARRDVWADAYRDIIGHVIDAAVKAPRGQLKGSVVKDGDRVMVTLAGDTDRTLEITWPDLSKTPIDTLVNAIKTADDTGKMPPVTTMRLLLAALGVEDVDELIAGMTDENGEWVDPDVTAGTVAVKNFRQGRGEPVNSITDPTGTGV